MNILFRNRGRHVTANFEVSLKFSGSGVVLIILLFGTIANGLHSPQSDDTFDFIVVGAGTAGCVVASRLSEMGKYSVALLESGGYPIPESFIPALSPLLPLNPMMTKTYATVPQRNAGQNNNGTLIYAYGNTLGGGSAVNGMFFNRGSPQDFDNWANLTGDESWSYAKLLKYFKMVEDYDGDFPSDQHGYGGPITITRPRYAPGYDVWRATAKAFGFPFADQNGPQRISFTPAEVNKRHGRRVSSFTGYIEPHLGSRRNLHVFTNALVTRIVFDGTRAVGVKYSTNTSTGVVREYLATARKEIILSAGVIESPVLLMKSGVGPREELLHAKVKPVKYLPVGQNFHDHTVTLLSMVINNRSDVFIPERDLTPETWRIYNETGEGPPSSYTGETGQAFLASSNAKENGEGNWADLHFIQQHTAGDPGLFALPEGMQMADWEAVITPIVLLTRPQSRGSVTLNKTDIDGAPLIDPQYLVDPKDMSTVVEGIKLFLQLLEKSPPYRKLGVRYPPNPTSGCEHFKLRSDPYWECYVRRTTQSGWHGAGTCRMGKANDPAAVVDSKLRVIGIDGLRVVDTSIMPVVTNANTMAPAFAIAEKAADMILRHWDKPSRGSVTFTGWIR